MKIALTISGQPRRYRHGFKELKRWFLDRYDIDVYLHAWQDKQFKKYDFFNEGKLKYTYNVEENTYQNLIDWYQPKDYLFEKAIKFDATELKGQHNQRLNSQMGMWMSLKRAWDLVEKSGIKYDLVIKTRYDLLWTHRVAETCTFLEDITQVNPDAISYFEYPPQWHMADQINDTFAVGGYDVMKTYHNVFPQMLRTIFVDPEYYNFYFDMFVNETLLRQHLRNHNIPLSPVYHGFNGYRGLDGGCSIMR
jgi:hypothetical protein